jgi:hypothetical protein
VGSPRLRSGLQRLKHGDAEILAAVLQSFTEPSRFKEKEHSSEILQRVDDFKIGMLRIVRGSKLFITQSKRIGLTSLSTEIGDEAWVVRGGQVPFLLRRRNAGDSPDYMLVSDCFVHGCMDGELADGLERNPTQIRIS